MDILSQQTPSEYTRSSLPSHPKWSSSLLMLKPMVCLGCADVEIVLETAVGREKSEVESAHEVPWDQPLRRLTQIQCSNRCRHPHSNHFHQNRHHHPHWSS